MYAVGSIKQQGTNSLCVLVILPFACVFVCLFVCAHAHTLAAIHIYCDGLGLKLRR